MFLAQQTECAVNKTIIKTLAELGNDTIVLEVMLDGLKPDVTYQITVAAFNQVGRGTVKSVTATTDQEGRVIIMITTAISCLAIWGEKKKMEQE